MQRAFMKTVQDIINAQNQIRRLQAKQVLLKLRRKKAVTVLQSYRRGAVCSRSHKMKISSVIRIQTRARTSAAVKAYVIALAEFKENSKLENKLKMLQQQLEQQKACNHVHI